MATVADPLSVTITDDNTDPTVVSVTGTDGTYGTGDNIDLVIKFSEAATYGFTNTAAGDWNNGSVGDLFVWDGRLI